MKWLSGSQQMDAQKCPMCNSDITVEILEKAIEEAASRKPRGLAGIFSRDSPQKAKPGPSQR